MVIGPLIVGRDGFGRGLIVIIGSRGLIGGWGDGFGRSLFLAGCWLSTWAAWWSSRRVKYGLRWVVWFGWFGLSNGFANDCVVAVRELVTALIAVEGGGNGPNGNALSDTTFKILFLFGENLYVLSAEMMVIIRRMLHDGRFE